MLELTSGPTAMHSGKTGDTLSDVTTAPSAFYDDSLGLCAYSTTLGGYCLVQLDGTAYLRSGLSQHYGFTLDLQRPGGWLVHASSLQSALYEWNKANGTVGALVIETGVTNDVTGLAVRAQDRYLDIISGVIRYRPLDLSAAVVTEATLSGAGSGLPTASRTRSDNIIALTWTTGPVCYYDVVNRVQVGSAFNIGANQGAWYSSKHDIFVSMYTQQIRVFANAVRPASVSNPTALLLVAQAHVSELRVRLLGANSDPAAGELVNWSVTIGSGSLRVPQSMTDADGYAYNDYIAPVGSTGSVTVQAQVLF